MPSENLVIHTFNTKFIALSLQNTDPFPVAGPLEALACVGSTQHSAALATADSLESSVAYIASSLACAQHALHMNAACTYIFPAQTLAYPGSAACVERSY